MSLCQSCVDVAEDEDLFAAVDAVRSVVDEAREGVAGPLEEGVEVLAHITHIIKQRVY